jgi:hypothetical protein
MSTLRISTFSNLSGSSSTSADTIIKGNVKAWVNFNGTGVLAIRTFYNVATITDNGTGDYTINLSNPLTDANYAFVMQTGGTSSAYTWRTVEDLTARTASSIRVYTVNSVGGLLDPAQVGAAFFR